MRRTLRQITSDRAAPARNMTGTHFIQIIDYAQTNLNGRSDDKIHDAMSLIEDAVISTFVSIFTNNLLRERLHRAGVIDEIEYINFSNVHVNLPASVEEKIFISFDAYSTVFNPERRRVTTLILWEINTRINKYDVKRKFVNFGLDRVHFVRKSINEVKEALNKENIEVENFVYVVLAPLDRYDVAGLAAVAEEKNITFIFIDYNKLEDVFDRTVIEAYITKRKKKRPDIWRIFSEHLEGAGLTLDDVIEVYVPQPAPTVVDEVPEHVEIPSV